MVAIFAPLVWIDMEMTGLDPEQHVIIEIATIVTDGHLNIVAEGPAYAIRQPDEALAAMDEWNTRQHTASGLVERVKASAITEAQAEAETLAFLTRYLAPQASPLCGNSIMLDRRFLLRYMPKLEAFFHYRNLDVSTVKELAKRWRPEIAKNLNKQGQHLALADIRESIAELVYYREHFFDTVNCTK